MEKGKKTYGGFLKWWYPQIVFHYKPSILGAPPFFLRNPHMAIFGSTRFQTLETFHLARRGLESLNLPNTWTNYNQLYLSNTLW